MKAKNILMICLLFPDFSAFHPRHSSLEKSSVLKPSENWARSISSPSSTIPDDIFRLMQGKTYKKNCTMARSELRYIRCLHVDKDGRNIVGEMVVNKAIATDVLDILKKLYEAKYPIERMRLIDYWDADDERAMRANNSSSFNFRFISHTHTVSKHGRDWP